MVIRSVGSALDRTTENEDGGFHGMKPFAEASNSEESGAGKSYAEICTGAVG